MINEWLFNSGIKRCCSELKESLSKWYDLFKHNGINGHELAEVKKQFFKDNPQYQQYEFNIHCGFDVDGTTWRPGCLDGCCQTRAVVTGVYVVPVDWDYTRNLAFKESKVLKQIAETGNRYYKG